MTATHKTKRDILELFVGGTPLTLTDISCKLGLAGSTVNQHLNELKVMGAIQEVDRQGTKKWKYYKLNLYQADRLYTKWSQDNNCESVQQSPDVPWNSVKQYDAGKIGLIMLSKKAAADAFKNHGL